MTGTKSTGHGGYREGSGRKKEFGEPTKVMRVPESMMEEVRKFIESGVETKNDVQDKIYELEEENNQLKTQVAELQARLQQAEQNSVELQELQNKIREIGVKVDIGARGYKDNGASDLTNEILLLSGFPPKRSYKKKK